MRRSVLVGIVGPTASGKSALALRLAEAFDGEIVGCDALQVYRGADIGTGKLPVSEQRGIPHHLLDVADPSREFSAASYIRLAAPIVEDIYRRGKLPLVVGGTGLYLRALLRGLFDGPGRDPKLRRRIAAVAARRGSRFVHRMLVRVDPVSAKRIHQNDTVRAVRALEVSLLAKRPMSDMMRERRTPLVGFRIVLMGITPARPELARRIEARIDEMFDGGLVDEVRGLVRDFGPDAPVLKGIGYRQVAQYLVGQSDLERARCLTLKATLQYAKRQMTWFRGEEGVVWFAGNGDDPEVADAIEQYLRGQEKLLHSLIPLPYREDSGRQETSCHNQTRQTPGEVSIEVDQPPRAPQPIEAIEEERVHAKTAS
jgi:tRNA dimethylallyltransferase